MTAQLPPGYTLDPPAPPPTGRDVAKNVAAGAVEGGTSLLNIATDPFGTVIGPGIARIGGTLYDAGAHLFGYPAMTQEQRADLYGTAPAPSAEQPIASRVVNAVNQAIPGAVGPADVPANTPAQQIARKVTGAVVAGGAGGIGPAVVSAGGALAGDVAGRVAPDWVAPGAELLGNVAGGYVTGRVASPVRTVTTPERQRLVDVAQQENIPLTAGETTGSKPLMKTEQMLGQTMGSAGGVAADVEQQQRAVNSAVASRAGLNSETLTPDVVNTHLDNLGNEIGSLAAANNLQMTPQFVQQLGQVRQGLRYVNTAAAQEVGARIDQLRDMITLDANGNPVLAGPHYQTLMGDLRPAITGAEGTTQRTLLQFRDMLRQQMEASMNPADAAQWRQLNRYYANGKVIQDAMGAAGAGTAEGNISLLQLRGAINRSLGSDAYAGGYGDLNDLARVGQSVLRRPPDSGTPQGVAINALLHAAPFLAGGFGGFLHGLEGAAIGTATPWAIGAAVRGRIPGTNFSPGQSYLANQLTRDVDPRITAAIIQAANAETERNRLAPKP